MSGGARDAAAARAAFLGFLVSVGAIAILTWLPTRFLADWAVYPVDLDFAQQRGESVIEAYRDFDMSKRDFQLGLVGSAELLCILTAIYWIVAFLLGAGRTVASPRPRFRGPSVLLGAALVIWMAFSFVGAAPRFIFGPLVDACAQRLIAAQPELAFTSATIHGCESRVSLYFSLSCLLPVIALLGISLAVRYRQRLPAGTA